MPDDLDLRDVHGRHEPDPAFRLELRRQVEAIVHGAALPTTTATSNEPNEEDLIMLTDTRTDGPKAPSRTQRWLLPAAVAALLVVAAAIAVTARDDDGESTVAGTTTTTLGADVVFQDDFADDTGAWESLSLYPFISVEGGQQVWNVSPAGQTEFLRPHIDEQRLVDMEVTAAVASVDPDSTVGVYCRKGGGNQDYYYFFRLAPAGATIGVVPEHADGPTQVITDEPSFTRPAGPFELTARCIDADGVTQLELLVDGASVISGVHDEPLGAGYGALEVQAGPPGSAASEVRWDEFTVTAR